MDGLGRSPLSGIVDSAKSARLRNTPKPDILARFGYIMPGHVMAVKTTGFTGDMIRFGACLIDEPNLSNHIAVLDHMDDKGTWWCIEGRPGGVGWRDATAYLSSEHTITNQGQHTTAPQRDAICKFMQMMLGVGYDWRAIAEDGARDLHIPDPWGETWNGEQAGHVVCSSVAALAYSSSQLQHPIQTNLPHIQPADWVSFILGNGYE